MSESSDTPPIVESPNGTINGSPNATKLLLLYSFGHQHGAPDLLPAISSNPCIPHNPFSSANHLIDARILPNPPKDIRKQFTGLSPSFQQTLLMDDEKGRQFYDTAMQSIFDYLGDASIPDHCVIKIGIGCRMGKHRSVATVECLAREMPNQLGPEWRVMTRHRDVTRKKEKKETKDSKSESDRD